MTKIVNSKRVIAKTSQPTPNQITGEQSSKLKELAHKAAYSGNVNKDDELEKLLSSLPFTLEKRKLADMKHHPKNPRRGSVSTIKESIKSNGYYPTIMIQRSTNYVIKSNHTFKGLKELNVETKYAGKFDEVYVIVVDVDNAHALRIVLMDNKTSDKSGYDNNDLFEAMKETERLNGSFFGTGYNQEDFDYLLRVTGNASAYKEGQEEVGTELGDYDPTKTKLQKADVPDAVWPSDNTQLVLCTDDDVLSSMDAGIPNLLPQWQTDAFDLPILVWGTQRGRKMKGNVGTYLFYTADSQLDGVWRNPTGLLNTVAINAVEVNFSIYPETPPAVAFYNTYRKRWLSRYWQSQGRRIIVDMFVPEEFWPMNLLGVPKGWRAWATRADVIEHDMLERYFKCACEHAETDDILFLLYGGAKTAKAYAKERGWLWVPEELAVQQGKHIEESMKPEGRKRLA